MTVSIKDVARRAGVSPATVSRALGKGPVSEALRAQVREAVLATGYRPNLAARRLRSQESGTIGLIVADIRNPFFTAVSRAVEDQAFAAGLRVILCNTDEDPVREASYLRLMQEERVTGLIFAPTRAGLEHPALRELLLPMVMIDRAGPAGLCDAVVLDNAAASEALVEHLWAQGYRRIAGLFGHSSSTGQEREAGYRAAMTRHGMVPRARFVAPREEAGEAALAALLDGAEPAPDAVMVSNGLLLMGVLRGARARGLALPDDLALAGFDNEAWTGLVQPGLTVIEQPVEAIGRTAMELLFARLANPTGPLRKVVLSGRCIPRGSTAARV